MIPEMPPQRNAKPGFAPSSIIERAAQHLDWTVAFGMRHNTLRGVEETTFAVSVGLLLFAIVMTFWIRPDRPIKAVPSLGRLAVAGQ